MFIVEVVVVCIIYSCVCRYGLFRVFIDIWVLGICILVVELVVEDVWFFFLVLGNVGCVNGFGRSVC